MTRTMLLVLLLAAALPARSQRTLTYAQLTKLVSPPGAILVQDSLWMDEAEVANLHWLEYLHQLQRDSSEAQYRAALPDTMVWSRELSRNDPYITYYLRHYRFRYYPVVGINYLQAMRYCRWRSAEVNKLLHSAEYLKKHSKLRGYEFRVEYRLPTVREWELAAAGGLDPAQYPHGQMLPPLPGSKSYRRLAVPKALIPKGCLADSVRNYQLTAPVFYTDFNVREKFFVGTPQQAFACPNNYGLSFPAPDGAMITEFLYSHAPNPLGIFNMIGNVAELTATPGVAKGGSWAQSIKTFVLQSNLFYRQPCAWLGFRCACTVYIKPKT